MTCSDAPGVRVEERDVLSGAPLDEQGLRLGEKLLREVERMQVTVTDVPQAHRDPAGAATCFEHARRRRW